MSLTFSRLMTVSLPALIVFAAASPALAQGLLPEIVVTATRSPTAISDSGSAISVIPGEEIAKASPKDISDALRTVPGLDVNTTGGPGSVTSVRIRGADAKNTLVLIDGNRVNDPSESSGSFDFSSLVPTDIERIEVLRGPQSALYGSDASGGVINIITRRGKGKPRVTISGEGGSYGSRGGSASISGGTDRMTYAFSVTGYDTDSFSRYGYRIGRIERKFPFGLENDPVQKLGVNGRVTVALTDTTELEIGGYSSLNVAGFDAAFGAFPDTPSSARQALLDGYIRLKNLMFDGRLTNRITLSGNVTDRRYRTVQYSLTGSRALSESLTRDQFRGDRLAAEYQGDLKLDAFGTLTLGARTERENVQTYSEKVLPVATPRAKTGDFSRTTNSVFALHQISPVKNLHLSLGGRIDAINDGSQFNTWRGTAAYDIEETKTTLRASVGTGAKAPTLYQLNDPLYGNRNLRPESSLGFDAGVDQLLFDDRVKLSATYFSNRFRNLIDFASDPSCRPGASGCFVNVARARTSGVELSGSVDLVPDLLRFNATYTYLHAIDAKTGLTLARRPEHSGRVGFTITPTEKLTIEPSVVLVSERYSSNGEKDRLAPYARLDARIEYRFDETFTVYVRGENLTNAHYQEVLNYGTPGRSVYGGLRATW